MRAQAFKRLAPAAGLHLGAGLCAALLCAAGTAGSDGALTGPHTVFPSLAEQLGESAPAAALAGFCAGLAVSAALPVSLASGGTARAAALRLAGLLNPLTLLLLATGPAAALAFAAALVVMRAVFFLAAEADERGAVALAGALAAAPFVSERVLLLYPVLIALAPALSPWGLARGDFGPQRLIGFLFVALAPLALAAAGAAYLDWLFAASTAQAAAPEALREAAAGRLLAVDPAGFAALAAAPGLLAAAAGLAPSDRLARAALIALAAAAGAIALAGASGLQAALVWPLTAQIAWAGAVPRRALMNLALAFAAGAGLLAL